MFFAKRHKRFGGLGCQFKGCMWSSMLFGEEKVTVKELKIAGKQSI